MGPIDARNLLIENLDQDQQEDPIYILSFNNYQMNIRDLVSGKKYFDGMYVWMKGMNIFLGRDKRISDGMFQDQRF
jgi:membrane-bound inhibitor of C-type lysozyme